MKITFGTLMILLVAIMFLIDNYEFRNKSKIWFLPSLIIFTVFLAYTYYVNLSLALQNQFKNHLLLITISLYALAIIIDYIFIYRKYGWKSKIMVIQ